jgi:hypothetical protein
MNSKMRSFKKLREAAKTVAEGVHQITPLTAQEIVNLFEQAGFFEAIEYGLIENDSRLENRASQEHADILIRSFTGSLLAVLQVEAPDTQIAKTFPRLAKHAQDLFGSLPDTLAMTNGNDLLLFATPDGQLYRTYQEFNLSDLTEKEAQTLYQYFNHHLVDWGRHLRAPHL